MNNIIKNNVKDIDIKEFIKNSYSEMLSIRRHIHSNPELSYSEHQTADFVIKKLNEYGVDNKRCTETGVVAHIGSGKPCIALRADMDALPIEEETGLEFSSKNKGIMHACGHDMHTTMLLIVAKTLKSIESELKGTIKLIFQPGEEKTPGGASIMIKEGVLENPKPEMIFGQHIFPEANTGTLSFNSGPVMGAADELYIKVIGKSTHAAQPHLGSDPITAATKLISYYKDLLVKQKDPIDSGVINITSIHGGTTTNIVPDEVKMQGTMRSFNPKWREEIHSIIVEKSKQLCEVYNCDCEFDLVKGYPPVINNEKATEIARKTAIKQFGNEMVLDFTPKMWGEDFSFYGEVIPACFWFLGVKNKELESMPALHNSKINPDEEAMINGSSMMVSLVLDYFG